MDLGLRGAKVLVTAASTGLGAATARQFSREGAQVVIASRTLASLQETAGRITAETGNPVYTYACDVTDENAVIRLMKNASETLGGLDVLIINAGGPPSGTFEAFSLEAWRTATDLTLLSAVSLVRHALPHLQQSQRAAVLAIASVSVKQPIENLTLSNVVRPSVIGLMKTLSVEYGAQGIRFNSLLPSVINTDRIDSLMQARAEKNGTTPDEERQKAAQAVPLGRLGEPEEFANVAVFVCSPAASYLNGVALPVDGGMLKGTW
jgi:3-oxoacyl-[acyl-carrier protein] reductase